MQTDHSSVFTSVGKTIGTDRVTIAGDSTQTEHDYDPIIKGEKLAPFNPTHLDACDIAIGMLNISSEDVVYDLGCGDGRFLLRSLERARICKGVGVEYDSTLVSRAMSCCSCAPNQVNSGRISIVHENVLDVDFSEATALFIYLVPAGIRAIR